MNYAPRQSQQNTQPTIKKLTEHQKQNLREAYEERRAILEYEAGYSRSEADRRAWLMTYGKQYE